MKVFLLGCCLLMSNLLFSQSVIAKFKYEEAEEAFNKNDFVTTLQKLDETQKLLGSTNPKIMYLRIMAEKAILEKGNYEYTLLDSARQHSAFFISNYEKNEGIEDKLKEVYLFAETLQKLPKSAAELAYLQEAPARAKAAKEAAATAFVDSLANAYQFKKGLTEEAFRKYNSYSTELVKKYRPHKKADPNYYRWKRASSKRISDLDNLYIEGPVDMSVKDGKVESYSYVIKQVANDKTGLQEATDLYNKIKTRIKKLFTPEEITIVDLNDNPFKLLVISHQTQLLNSLTIDFGTGYLGTDRPQPILYIQLNFQ